MEEEPVEETVMEEKEEVGTLKVGFLAPLTGDAAAWGLPGLYGVEMWVEDVNEAGGITAGGKTYMVEIVTYDEENIASKALAGAKKLVLNDEVSVVLMMAGPTVTTCQSFFTENEMLSFSLAPYDTRPEAPYHLASPEPSLVFHLNSIDYIAETYPDAKTIAIVAPDDEIGHQGMAYLKAACEVADIDVVYSKFFGYETVDFAPIMTAILAQDPDIISLDGSYAYYVELITEQAYQMGFDGVLESAEFILGNILQKVPEDWIEGAVASFPDWDDPKLSEYCNDFYEEYTTRWPDQWGAVSWEYAANLDIWKFGIEQADSVAPMDVFKALKAAPYVETVYGKANWTGEQIWGIDNFLALPWHTTEVQSGSHRIVQSKPVLDWLDRPGNRDVLIKHLKAENVYYLED
jgi:branched-chain amino acid transport system substrate-binding protein